ncbi:MAG: hypothetical protein KC431_30305, partial [Myxococcales bacterium]|nr:hypothetical protein [Myxococcales bacterium]
MISEEIHEFVTLVDRRWRQAEYDERRFAALAGECLAELDATGWSTPALLAHQLDPDREPYFRQTPELIPLYRGPRFDLCAHLWGDTIAIAHQHAWAGAFRILSGRSLNCYYDFNEHGRSNADLGWGRLTRERVAMHRAGDVVEVTPGPGFIHGLAYVDPRGLALSLRRKRREGAGLSYFRPSLVVDELACGEATQARLRALELAHEIDEGLYAQLLSRLLETGDRLTLFFVLRRATTQGWPLPPDLEARGCERFG